MTHNENIKTLNDIEHHFKLEAERLEAAKLFDCVYMTESSLCKALGFKRKRGYKYNQKGKRFDPGKKKLDTKKHPKGKLVGKKKGKSKMKYYNCSKMGHFACECTEPKKVRPNSNLLNYALVVSSVLLINFRPM